MNRLEELVLQLWGKGELIGQIASELGLDKEEVEDIIECRENYKEVTREYARISYQGNR